MKWLIVNGDDFGMSAGITCGITGVLPHVLVRAERLGVPVRGQSGIRRISKFYGRWGGDSHPEQIGVEALLRLMDAEVGEGVTELVCHPGYVEPGFSSSYAEEREVELGTLCDARVQQAIVVRGIRLIGFRDLAALVRRTESTTCPRS
jgi:predicted glycoside hydrolase/deacetylase ChbG (UPF0249 family)